MNAFDSAQRNYETPDDSFDPLESPHWKQCWQEAEAAFMLLSTDELDDVVQCADVIYNEANVILRQMAFSTGVMQAAWIQEGTKFMEKVRDYYCHTRTVEAVEKIHND